MNWLKDLFKNRGKQKKLKVAETAYNNLLWKDRSYLVDLIFVYNNKTKRDVRKLMESNTNLSLEEVKIITKLGAKKMRKLEQVQHDFKVRQR